MDFCEIQVKISDDEQRLTKDFTHQGNALTVSMEDPFLAAMVEETEKSFHGSPEKITVRIQYIWDKAYGGRKEMDLESD